MNLTFKISIRHALLTCAAACAALLGYALYLQHVLGLAPCPLCVLQRYAFLAVMAACLVGALTQKTGFGLTAGLLCALTGAGIAGRHLWVKANPQVSCGIDPLETSLNKIWPAQWLPSVFKADGLCSAEHAPIFGLSIPQWALVWFIIFFIGFAYLLAQRIKTKA